MNTDATGKELPKSKCPTCGHILDAATCTYSNARPRPGDFTVCISCGEILRFGEDMVPGFATVGDMLEVSDKVKDYLDQAQHLIRRYRPISK